ncbi:MAG TPA: phosphotransferase family protein [Dongiaceae bacterium]
MLSREIQRALPDFVRAAAGAERVEISVEQVLPGSAGRSRLLISAEIAGGPFAGRQALVLRGESDACGLGTLATVEEFAVRQAALGAGLTTPEPLWLEPNGDVLGRPFMILRHAPGTTDVGVLQDVLSVEEGDRLAYRLGQELARLHGIALVHAPAEIAFLPHPGTDWAEQRAAGWRTALDDLAQPLPCFEWAINWFLDHAPTVGDFALCHRDLRFGNFVADGELLVGILDFERAGWSDPMEDLGWLCARGARYGMPEREAGGIGSREALYDGYKDVAEHEVDDRRVRFWEIAAALRQGIHALQCAAQPSGEAEPGLQAILTGMQSVEMEYDLLMEIERFSAEGG